VLLGEERLVILGEIGAIRLNRHWTATEPLMLAPLLLHQGAKFVFDADRLARCTHLVLGGDSSADSSAGLDSGEGASSALAGKRTVRGL
jgi:hypothetical protein